MPVDIVGADSGPEHEAAQELRRLLLPVIGDGHLLIVVGAQCIGEEVQDIDLLLLGVFGRGLRFRGQHGLVRGKTVRLVNLCLILEVKDHAGDRVRFDSQHVRVLYRTGWSDASDQVRRQSIALWKFLQRHDIAAPRIEGAIWLRNFDGEIPRAAANVLGASPGSADFLALVERVRAPQSIETDPYIAFTKNDNVHAIQRASAFFRAAVVPTALDRRRLEHICRKLISDQKYITRLGQQLLIFRGRGGSGKTIHLLRLAKDLYDNGQRVLFLTFNKALVADIRRLLVLLAISNQGFDRGIHILTANKFFVRMLSVWSMWEPVSEHGFQRAYNERTAQLLELFSDETPESLAKDPVVVNSPEVFGWDYVLVDEGQDWPETERDLLYRCFGAERCIVADGVDQLVRNARPCDWAAPSSARKRQVVPLRRAMRMKANLCQFIRSFAEEMGGDWDQEVNTDIVGGRVTIIRGPYTRAHHDDIFSEHRKQGNEPVDALFCAPPDTRTERPISSQLREWGLKVWDGTSEEVRETFPTTIDEHRVVKYESCRGLEGWTVVCYSLDAFFVHRLRHATVPSAASLFETPETFAQQQATAWTLIPLTRAIDHLVIQLNGHGLVTSALRKLADLYPEFVTWHGSN